MKREMRIYEFKYLGGEIDWVFAPNMKEAKEFYLGFTGCGDLSEATVKRVPKDQWCQMYVVDPNEIEPEDSDEYNEDDYSGGFKIIETLEEYAERNTLTDLIATSEY